MKFELRVKRFNGTFSDVPAIAVKLQKAVDSYEQFIADGYARTIRTWKRRPMVHRKQGLLSFSVIVYDPVYQFVDEGTPAHDIRPRRPGHLLIFNHDIRPKTRPGILGSTAGTAGKRPPSAHQLVRHPGIKPRQFTDTIMVRLVPRIDRMFDTIRFSSSST